MTIKDTLIDNHNDYILDIKVDNFKNYLNTFVKELLKLETRQNESNSNLMLRKNATITFEEFKTISSTGEELVREFNNIENKIKSNEAKVHKDKINNLKKVIEEADTTISMLENSLNNEKKTVKEMSSDVDGYIKDVERLNELVNAKNIEILDLKAIIDTHQNVKISTEYVSKLNDGNQRLIAQKNEKIMVLEAELAHEQTKITDYESKIKELEESNIHLEQNIGELSKKYKELSKKNVSFADEMNITMNNDLLTELKIKNRSLEEDVLHLKCIVGNNDSLNNPLLDKEKSRDRCDMCCML